jgi:hypothetical protein
MTQWLQSAAVSEDVSMLGPVGPGGAGRGKRRSASSRVCTVVLAKQQVNSVPVAGNRLLLVN